MNPTLVNTKGYAKKYIKHLLFRLNEDDIAG